MGERLVRASAGGMNPPLDGVGFGVAQRLWRQSHESVTGIPPQMKGVFNHRTHIYPGDLGKGQ